MKIARYYTTIKHLKAKQLFYQLIRRVQKITDRSGVIQKRYSRDYSDLDFKPCLITPPFDSTTTSFDGSSTFTFLNQTRQLAKGEWFPKDASLLWLFNLHYFEYLVELDSAKKVEQIISDWLANVKPCHPLAWHPAVISHRVFNWIYAYSKHSSSFSAPFKSRLLYSLYNQLNYLSNRLEFNLLGNHLFTNSCSLIVGGVFFRDDKLLKKGLALLVAQLKEQFLPDGGHFERSPAYHLLMVHHLVYAIEALAQTDYELSPLKEALNKAALFLEKILISNQIPLLNDSSYDMTLAPLLVLKKAKQLLGHPEQQPQPQQEHYLKESGLFVYSSKQLSYLFDCGPLGPDYLLGHAHNDTLTFLLSFGAQDLIVDSGVYQYQEGKWRNYFRSSKAHNVITVNDTEPNEIWKSFRVGRRGKAPAVTYIPRQYIEATDNAYTFLGVTITRRIERAKQATGIIVTDTVKNSSGQQILIESNLHFHSGAKLQKQETVGNEQHLTIELDRQHYQLTVFDSAVRIEEKESYYSPKFGEKAARLNLGMVLISKSPETLLRFALIQQG